VQWLIFTVREAADYSKNVTPRNFSVMLICIHKTRAVAFYTYV